MTSKVAIKRLSTGITGLDTILGGGIPEFSFNLIVGEPGSGKTTLAHQIMFGMATPEHPALFFSILGEPLFKMLRYQQQYSFYDLKKINKSIKFISLSSEAETGDYLQVLNRISNEVAANAPGFVFIDSYRSILKTVTSLEDEKLGIQRFVHQLGIQLSSLETTSFLIGEYSDSETADPIYTVADGIIMMVQNFQRNSMVRQIQISKMRGQSISPGRHTFRISNDGLKIFPSATPPDDNKDATKVENISHQARLSIGNAIIDEMLGGGIPPSYSVLIAGPSGSGKSILTTSFLTEGVAKGEAGIIVAFEQVPSHFRNPIINNFIEDGKLELINLRSFDLSIDEILHQLIDLITKNKVTRVVVDSLSGFELSVSPIFREDFKESLFRLMAVLTQLNVTVLLTTELEDRYTDLRFSPNGTAFLTDAIIVQRYIEIDSAVHRVMSVVKVRASNHSREIRQYEITDDGIQVGGPLYGYEGLLSGKPTPTRHNRND